MGNRLLTRKNNSIIEEICFRKTSFFITISSAGERGVSKTYVINITEFQVRVLQFLRFHVIVYKENGPGIKPSVEYLIHVQANTVKIALEKSSRHGMRRN